MRNAFIEAITVMAQKDPELMLVTGDLGFGFFDDFSKRFPSQFLNVGVAEQNMIGISAGLALEGKKVFAYSIAGFGSHRCLEQIRNELCYHRLNVNVVISGSGFSYGPLGFSHHSVDDLTLMRSLQNIVLVSPADAYEAKEATFTLAARSGPGYLRLERSAAPLSTTESFRLGQARKVREGADITLIATGGITADAVAASERLQAIGIGCRVLSMHTVQPLDGAAILSAARETGGIVTIEEHLLDGGFGAAVAELCMDERVRPRRFERIGLKKPFKAPVGSQVDLRTHFELDANSIFIRVRNLLQTECE